PGIKSQIRDETLITLDRIVAAGCPGLFEDHQHRRIVGLEDTQVPSVDSELRELRLDRQYRQPLGDIDQLDQSLDGDPRLFDLTPAFVGSGSFGLLFGRTQTRPLIGLPAVFGIMRLDSFHKNVSGKAARVDPALRFGPSCREPLADPRVADLLQPVGPQAGSPSDLSWGSGQRRPAGLVLRRLGRGDSRFDVAEAPSRMPFFCLLELAAILLFPFFAVFVGYEAVLVPE